MAARDARFSHLAHPALPLAPGQYVGLQMDSSMSIQCIQEVGPNGCKLIALGALLTTPGVWHPFASLLYLLPAVTSENSSALRMQLGPEDACYRKKED